MPVRPDQVFDVITQPLFLLDSLRDATTEASYRKDSKRNQYKIERRTIDELLPEYIRLPLWVENCPILCSFRCDEMQSLDWELVMTACLGEMLSHGRTGRLRVRVRQTPDSMLKLHCRFRFDQLARDLGPASMLAYKVLAIWNRFEHCVRRWLNLPRTMANG